MVVPKPNCRVLRYPRFCVIFRRKTRCIRRRRKAGTTGINLIWAMHTLNLSSCQLAHDFTIGIHNSWRTCRKFGVIPMSSNIISSFVIQSAVKLLITHISCVGIFWHHDTTTWGIASRLRQGMTERGGNKFSLHAMDMQAFKRVEASRTLQAFQGDNFSPPNYCYLQTNS